MKSELRSENIEMDLERSKLRVKKGLTVAAIGFIGWLGVSRAEHIAARDFKDIHTQIQTEYAGTNNADAQRALTHINSAVNRVASDIPTTQDGWDPFIAFAVKASGIIGLVGGLGIAGMESITSATYKRELERIQPSEPDIE